MNNLSILFSYDKKANMASCRLSNSSSAQAFSSENTQIVEYDLNKISAENAFTDFYNRLDFFKSILKTSKSSTYGQD